MSKEELKKFMQRNYRGRVEKPLDVLLVNDKYIVAIYQGNKGSEDIIIRYREKINNKWSRIRTPKHIHWVVDILLKINNESKLRDKFLKLLEKYWNQTSKITSPFDIQIENFLPTPEEVKKYKKLNKKGFYSVKFLILLARLLMIQEKTNYPTGTITDKILKHLKDEKDLFQILHLASLGKL